MMTWLSDAKAGYVIVAYALAFCALGGMLLATLLDYNRAKKHKKKDRK